VAVGCITWTGVFVGVGGNQTVVGVGVSVGAYVAVGVGGINVEDAQAALMLVIRMQMVTLQIHSNLDWISL
jgi:hypothetical protein